MADDRQSSLLCETPRTYLYWWTFVPVLPSSRSEQLYHALRRQWADHTMNPLVFRDGRWRPSSSRGFYIENREDHIATVLFHIWAMFDESRWVAALLDECRIPHGRGISRVRWSYSFEQRRSPGLRPDITDIVLSFEDEEGEAVVVIETKKRGGKLSEKD